MIEPHNMTLDATPLAESHREEWKFWFCLRTHPKHEHIAAAGLSSRGIQAFNPQLRIRRATRRGPVWFNESVFIGYIFARFDLQTQLDSVRYCGSVSEVVHFNSGYPSIPEAQMNELKAIFGADDLLVMSPGLSTGDTVRIVGGAFHDLVAVVKQVLPAKQRVQTLLEFLGQMTMVELDLQSVTVTERCPSPHHPLSRHAAAEVN